MYRILLSLSVVLTFGVFDETDAGEKIGFWDMQRKGANFFNKVPVRQRFEAAGELGLEFVRLAPDKWESAGGKDFLIGDADNYEQINEKDFTRLKQALDMAEDNGVKIVLTMLSLPGARWVQLNNDKEDERLWSDEEYQKQAMKFWQDLAKRLNGHPAVVGYDPLNEPHPARVLEGIDDLGSKEFKQWVKKAKGTAADLNRFNRRIVAAIREVDKDTPIMLEGYAYGSADGIKLLEPVDDNKIVYSFHFYEPWNYTTARVNKDRFSYPEKMPINWAGDTEKWTKENLAWIMKPVMDWSRLHKVPANRIAVSEFGCARTVAGAQEYLADVIEIINEQNWHWAFYSYREDTWNSMDYELGTGKLDWKYWQAVEASQKYEKPWHDNPLFDVLKSQFKR